jgi:hypothetical protein
MWPVPQLGALGLVTNAVLLWNTLYAEAVHEQLKIDGYKINADDTERVSPLQHGHINVLGRYSFMLAESVAQGKLRPLNIHEDAHISHNYNSLTFQLDFSGFRARNPNFTVCPYICIVL